MTVSPRNCTRSIIIHLFFIISDSRHTHAWSWSNRVCRGRMGRCVIYINEFVLSDVQINSFHGTSSTYCVERSYRPYVKMPRMLQTVFRSITQNYYTKQNICGDLFSPVCNYLCLSILTFDNGHYCMRERHQYQSCISTISYTSSTLSLDVRRCRT